MSRITEWSSDKHDFAIWTGRDGVAALCKLAQYEDIEENVSKVISRDHLAQTIKRLDKKMCDRMNSIKNTTDYEKEITRGIVGECYRLLAEAYNIDYDELTEDDA